MMMPRLKLLREFLSEVGVIFISCDDNELANLRVFLNEIFGESNFYSQVIVRANSRGQIYTQILGAKKAWKELFDEFPDHDFESQVVFEDEWQNKINELME